MDKVEAHEADLRRLYSSVFNALINADTNKFSEGQRKQIRLLEASLDRPESIELSGIAAVLHSINCAELECFFPLPVEGHDSVGTMVRSELRRLDLHYHDDLHRYMEEKGYNGPLKRAP